MNKEYYLAHPFDSRKEIREWELRIEKDTGIKLINPFYDVFREDVQDIDAGVKNPQVKPFRDIVIDDLSLIEKSNGIVAVINGSNSVGTYQEMVYAYIWGKPVFSIVTNGKENHPWIRYHSNEIFISFVEFENWIKTA